jgi:PAS domain S-box-containing protein
MPRIVAAQCAQMPRSFRSRVLLASLLAFVAMLALLQWNAQRQLTRALDISLADQAALIGPLAGAAIAPLVAARDYATLQDLVQRSVGPQGLAELVVLDRRGQRLAAAGTQGEGPSVTLPLELAGQRYGEARARLHADLPAQARVRLQRDGLLIGGTVLLGGALLLALAVRLLGRDLERIAGASRRIAGGDLDVELPVQGATEVRQVAEAFNTMSQAVRDQLQAVRDSEQRLRGVVAAMSEGLLVQDGSGTVVDSNEAAARVLGLPREALIAGATGLPRSQLLTPEGRLMTLSERPAWRALRTGQPQREPKVQVLRQDGTRAWLQIASEPVPRPDGSGTAYVVSTLTDISDRVAAEATLRAANQSLEERVAERTQALRQALDAAEQASHAKSEFLSRMSHELRTPLNAILGFAQLLALPRPGLDESEQQRIAQIESAGWHLLALIDDVLDLSRIEVGAMTVSLEPVALGDAAAQALQMASPQAQRHGVALEPLPGEAPWVHADRRRLLQVLGNLLSNAIKYNRPQGRVALRWSADAAEVRLEVADTGRGMTAEQLQQLYVPFTRFDTGTVEGTGIGLVITRRLVELMGGRLEVRSTVGEGTGFTVVLPRSEPAGEPAAPGPERETAAADPDPRRIVYVEDNPSNRRLMAEVLALRPHLRLETAADGLEGLALLQRPPRPDLALIDIDLPGLDGLALCRRLKADPALAGLPLMAVTAQAMKGDLERMRAAGFDAVVTKPLDVQRLLDQIDHLLTQPR